MISKIKKFVGQVRDAGLGSVLNKARRDHIFARHHEIYIRLAMADLSYQWFAQERGYDVFEIKTKDNPALDRAKRDFPKRGRGFDDYIDVGCWIYTIESDGRVVGLYICALENFYDKNLYRLNFKLEPHECYGFGFLVNPKDRGSQAAKLILSEGFRMLLGQGKTHMKAVCTSESPALYRFYLRMGFIPTGKAIDFYRILHFRMSRWTVQRELLNMYKGPTKGSTPDDVKETG